MFDFNISKFLFVQDDVKEGETALDKEKPVVKEKEKDKTKEKEKSKDKKKDADEKKSEPNFEILSNPARVMNQQVFHVCPFKKKYHRN